MKEASPVQSHGTRIFELLTKRVHDNLNGLLFLNPYPEYPHIVDESHLLEVVDMFPDNFPERIRAAFESVPRQVFIKDMDFIYDSLEYEIEDSVFTIESGKVLGHCLQQLNIEEGNVVLDIGCGTGFTAALCAVLAGTNGNVHTIDVDTLLLNVAQRRIQSMKFASHAPLTLAHESCFQLTVSDHFDRIFCVESKCPKQKLNLILAAAKPSSVVVVRLKQLSNFSRLLLTMVFTEL